MIALKIYSHNRYRYCLALTHFGARPQLLRDANFRLASYSLCLSLISLDVQLYSPTAHLLIECSAMSNRLVCERDWSPLREPCLSRTKSSQFGNAVLDRSKPLKYDIRSGNLVDQCVLCSLVACQLDKREPRSSLTFEVASVSVSRWSELFPLMPNPRIRDGSQTTPDGATWLEDPLDYSKFRMSFDNDETGREDTFLLLMFTKDSTEANFGLTRSFCGLIVEELRKPVQSLFKRAGILNSTCVRSCGRDSRSHRLEQHPSAAQVRDYSIMWDLQHAPTEDLTDIK